MKTLHLILRHVITLSVLFGMHAPSHGASTTRQREAHSMPTFQPAVGCKTAERAPASIPAHLEDRKVSLNCRHIQGDTEQLQAFEIQEESPLPKNEPFSLISFVLGLGAIVFLLLSWIPFLGVAAAALAGICMLLSPLTLAFGIVGLSRHNRHPTRFKAKWMAILGTVLGAIFVASMLLLFVLVSQMGPIFI